MTKQTEGNIPPMIADRLGQAVYWVMCGAAVLTLVFAFVAVFDLDTSLNLGDDALGIATLFAVTAVVFWLIGRACLYVLAGR